MITITDIDNWCAEWGEEYFDRHQPITINYFLGYLAGVDKELFTMALDMQLKSFERHNLPIEIQTIWSRNPELRDTVVQHFLNLVNQHQFSIDKTNESLTKGD